MYAEHKTEDHIATVRLVPLLMHPLTLMLMPVLYLARESLTMDA